MSGDAVLDGLLEVFPLVNLSTLIEVSIQFKDDIDGAAEYVIQNVLPNIVPDPSPMTASAPIVNEDLHTHGHQKAFDDAGAHLQFDLADTNSNSVRSDLGSKIIVEIEDGLVVKQSKQSPAGLSSEVYDVPSTSGQDGMSEEVSSDSLLLESSQLQHSSMRNPETSASEGDMSQHDDCSPDMTMQSSYSVNLESLDDVIANENYKKITLLSNVAAINEMLQEVELNEENTKRVISEASQAGNDILAKVEELKEMTTLATEHNNKVAGEIFAEKSILATEAQEFQTRLFNISEETKNFVLTIDEMHNTLQRRLAAAEAERAAAEKAKLEREASAQKTLEAQEFLLEAAKEESKRLEEQAQENAKLKELLMDRGHVVDALHGEMLGIFDSITQLKLRVDMQLTVDEPLQQISPSLSASAVDEPLQQVSSSFSSLVVGEPLQHVPSNLSSSTKSASSMSSSVKLLESKSWSSAAESILSLKDDEKIADVSDGNSDSDDSWDVIEDQASFSVPTVFISTPMLL
ncbi:hypothetical protein ACP70R_034426 [Stipagrostis hirtigluma subsp. patula]